MNIMRFKATRARQTGFSLLEILIGLVIGLLALSASIQVFQNLSQSQAEQSQSVRLESDAQQLMRGMAIQVQMAGSQALRRSGPGTVELQSINTFPIVEDTTGSISIQHALTNDATHAGCLWGSADQTTGVSTSTYKLGDDNTLRCTSDGGTQPLMDNVRQMQWQLAVGSSAGLRWLSPKSVRDDGLSGRVVAAQICVHIEGARQSNAPSTVESCDGNNISANGRQQVVQRRTIWLAALRS